MNNIPKKWRNFFTKIANNRDYVYSFCNRPYNSFHRHCRELYFYTLLILLKTVKVFFLRKLLIVIYTTVKNKFLSI